MAPTALDQEHRVTPRELFFDLVFLPLATAVSALAVLAFANAVWLALHTYELVWWREARAESRSVLASS
jgi:low temperature requirement protein LtrA